MAITRPRPALFRLALLGTAMTLCGSGLLAQGTKVRENTTRYLSHADLNNGASLGVDFLGHYIPTGQGAIETNDYIAVEVALFAPGHPRIAIHADQFQIRVNGHLLLPQAAGLILLDRSFPEMSTRPRVEIEGGAGDADVKVGGIPRQQRFPGDDPDHTPNTRRVPQVPVDISGGQVKKAPETPEEQIRTTALPEGEHVLPLSGYLYFQFEGKLKKIKKLELEYKGPLGQAVISLR